MRSNGQAFKAGTQETCSHAAVQRLRPHVIADHGNGALSTCSMVNASAKQQTGKRTETTATQRTGIFTAARLYSASGALSK
jgi:hypothetical protein